MKKPIVVVGSINMDLVIAAPRIPVSGETIIGTGFRTFAGGKGANQAVAVARLGWPVYLIGKVGTDVHGHDLRACLEEAGVKVGTVGVSNGSSGVALITTDRTGQNTIIVASGANDLLLPQDIDENDDLIRSAGFVLCQLEIPLATVLHLAHLCCRFGVPFMLDPAPVRQLPRELLEAVTWITPNESETRQLLAIDLGDNPLQDATAMAEAILGMGPKNVVLKMGRNGCYVASELPHLRCHNDAYPVAAIDTTAAGDAFNGAFATALLHEWDVQSATRFATATAAISVTRRGAQPSMPTLLEVTEFLRERGSDVSAWASDCSDHGEVTGSTDLKKETR